MSNGDSYDTYDIGGGGWSNWYDPNTSNPWGDTGGFNYNQYSPGAGWNYGGTVGNQGDFWDQLTKLLPSVFGTGMSAYLGSLGSQAQGTKTTDINQSVLNNWLPGTQDLANFTQGGLMQAVIPQQSMTPQQQQYWGGTAQNLLAGTDPNSIASQLALNQATLSPNYFYPSQQYGQAQSALNTQQQLAKTQFPQQVEQLTGWNRGRTGAADLQEGNAVANLLAQLSGQQQALSTAEAGSMQNAAKAASLANQYGIGQYVQTNPQSLQNILATQQYLGYPQTMNLQELARQQSGYSQLQNLLNTFMGHPTGTTGSQTQYSQTGANPLYSALSGLLAPYGQNLTSGLMGAGNNSQFQQLLDLLMKA